MGIKPVDGQRLIGKALSDLGTQQRVDLDAMRLVVAMLHDQELILHVVELDGSLVLSQALCHLLPAGGQ